MVDVIVPTDAVIEGYNSAYKSKIKDRIVNTSILGEGLPALQHLDDICEILENGGMIEGKTGSGKSMTLAIAAAERHAGNAEDGKVLIAQPLVSASRTQINGLREIYGDDFEKYFGLMVGKTHGISSGDFNKTPVQIGTTGYFVHRLQGMVDGDENKGINGNPMLSGIARVVIDEIHEEKVDQILLEALIDQANDRRRVHNSELPKELHIPEIKIVYASATVNETLRQSLNSHIAARNNGETLKSVSFEGRKFNIEQRFLEEEKYTQLNNKYSGDHAKMAAARAIEILDEGLVDDEVNDILIFVDGKESIDSVTQMLANRKDIEVHGYHAELSPEETDPILKVSKADLTKKGRLRRVIVATPALESGGTIPGIGTTIISGRANVNWYNPRTNRNELVTAEIGVDRIKQMAGRGGRDRNSVSHFIGTASQYAEREAGTLIRRNGEKYVIDNAEINNIDPSHVILKLAGWGIDLETAEIRRKPDVSVIRAAKKRLKRIGAFGENNQISEMGRRMSKLTIDPKYSRAVLEAVLISERPDRENVVMEVIDISTLASSGEIFRRTPSKKLYDEARANLSRYGNTPSQQDIENHAKNAVIERHNQLRRDVKSSVIDRRDEDIDDIDMYNYIMAKIRTLIDEEKVSRKIKPNIKDIQTAVISHISDEYNLVFRTLGRAIKESDNIMLHNSSELRLPISYEPSLRLDRAKKLDIKESLLSGLLNSVYDSEESETFISKGQNKSKYAPVFSETGDISVEMLTQGEQSITDLEESGYYNRYGSNKRYIVTDNVTTISNGTYTNNYSGLTFRVTEAEFLEHESKLIEWRRISGKEAKYNPEIDMVTSEFSPYIGRTQEKPRNLTTEARTFEEIDLEIINTFINQFMLSEDMISVVDRLNDSMAPHISHILIENIKKLRSARSISAKVFGENDYSDIQVIENPLQYIQNKYRNFIGSNGQPVSVYDLMQLSPSALYESLLITDEELGLPSDEKQREINKRFPDVVEVKVLEETVKINIEYTESGLGEGSQILRVGALSMEDFAKLKDIDLNSVGINRFKLSLNGIDQGYLEIGDTRKLLEDCVVDVKDLPENATFNDLRVAWISKINQLAIASSFDGTMFDEFIGVQKFALPLDEKKLSVINVYRSSELGRKTDPLGISVFDHTPKANYVDSYRFSRIESNSDIYIGRLEQFIQRIELILEHTPNDFMYGERDKTVITGELESLRGLIQNGSRINLIDTILYLTNLEFSMMRKIDSVDDEIVILPIPYPNQERNLDNKSKIALADGEVREFFQRIEAVRRSGNISALKNSPKLYSFTLSFEEMLQRGGEIKLTETELAALKEANNYLGTMEGNLNYMYKRELSNIVLEVQRAHPTEADKYDKIIQKRNLLFQRFPILQTIHTENKKDKRPILELELGFEIAENGGVPAWLSNYNPNDVVDHGVELIEQLEKVMARSISRAEVIDINDNMIKAMVDIVDGTEELNRNKPELESIEWDKFGVKEKPRKSTYSYLYLAEKSLRYAVESDSNVEIFDIKQPRQKRFLSARIKLLSDKVLDKAPAGTDEETTALELSEEVDTILKKDNITTVEFMSAYKKVHELDLRLTKKAA